MRATNARFVVTFIVAGTCLSGCAGNPAPAEWRQPAAAAQRSSRGGWIILEAAKASEAKAGRGPLAKGELIAIDETTFHVLNTAGLQSVPRSTVGRITLVGYGSPAGALAGWAVAGGVSTLSHGGFLLFTAPMWAIAGVVATHKEKQAGIVHDDEIARRFARFPQGLPPGFDPKTLGALTVPAGR